MALNKSAAAAPKFENPEDGDGFPGAGEGAGDEEDEDAVEVVETPQATGKDKLAEARRQAAAHAEKEAAAAAKAEAQPAKTTALAAKAGGAVAVTKIADLDPFKQLENQFVVEFNTFPQIKVNQGAFRLADGDKNMGDTIAMEVISWQKQWQLAPGDIDNPKAKEFLRYSKDGITAENGDDMKEILALAKSNGFPNAKISERVIVVGQVIDGGKQAKSTNSKIHQIDLSSTSVANFNRHRIGVALQASKGQLPDDFNASQVKMFAKAKAQGQKSWTEVLFGDMSAVFED